MTCKDCLYSPICNVYASFGVTDVPYDENDTCEMFKNKTDYVEVVWCRDCKHRYVPYDCALWYGTNNDTEYFIERGDDFFCSYAEKKEGVEE